MESQISITQPFWAGPLTNISPSFTTNNPVTPAPKLRLDEFLIAKHDWIVSAGDTENHLKGIYLTSGNYQKFCDVFKLVGNAKLLARAIVFALNFAPVRLMGGHALRKLGEEWVGASSVSCPQPEEETSPMPAQIRVSYHVGLNGRVIKTLSYIAVSEDLLFDGLVMDVGGKHDLTQLSKAMLDTIPVRAEEIAVLCRQLQKLDLVHDLYSAIERDVLSVHWDLELEILRCEKWIPYHTMPEPRRSMNFDDMPFMQSRLSLLKGARTVQSIVDEASALMAIIHDQFDPLHFGTHIPRIDTSFFQESQCRRERSLFEEPGSSDANGLQSTMRFLQNEGSDRIVFLTCAFDEPREHHGIGLAFYNGLRSPMRCVFGELNRESAGRRVSHGVDWDHDALLKVLEIARWTRKKLKNGMVP